MTDFDNTKYYEHLARVAAMTDPEKLEYFALWLSKVHYRTGDSAYDEGLMQGARYAHEKMLSLFPQLAKDGK